MIDIRYEVSKGVENSWMWIAWKLPKVLVRWCTIRVIAHATQGKYSHQIVPDLTAMDAVKRWEE